MKHRASLVTLFGLAALLALAVAAPRDAHAAPETVAFTGRLQTSAGPVDGSVQIVFRLYEPLAGGSELWTESQTVTAAQGLIHAQLGATTAITSAVLAHPTLHLEIQIGSEVLSPRVAINAVPYAVVAGSAETLGGLDPGDVVTDVTTGPGLAVTSPMTNVRHVALSTGGCDPGELWTYTAGGFACAPAPAATDVTCTGCVGDADVSAISAAKLTTGTVAYERLPVGTAANTVAAGNHTHPSTIVYQSFFFQNGGSGTLTGFVASNAACFVGRIDVFAVGAKCQAYLSGSQWMGYTEGSVFCNIMCMRW